MNRIRSWIFYAALAAAIAFIVLTSQLMPEQVGSHFNRLGVPRNLIPRDLYIWITVGMMVVLPLFVVIVSTACARKFPDLLNIPNRDYWMMPERRESTIGWIREQNYSLGMGVMACLCAGHYSTLSANLKSVPQMPGMVYTAGAALLGVAFIVWVVKFQRHFNSIEKDVHAPR